MHGSMHFTEFYCEVTRVLSENVLFAAVKDQ